MLLRSIAILLSVPALSACGASEANPLPPAAVPSEPSAAPPPSATVAPAPPAAAALIHCDLSAFLGSCEEHPTSNTSLQGTCEGIGGTFGPGPCPTEGRVGHCECVTADCTAAGVHPMYLYAPTISSDDQGQTMCGQLRFVRG